VEELRGVGLQVTKLEEVDRPSQRYKELVFAPKMIGKKTQANNKHMAQVKEKGINEEVDNPSRSGRTKTKSEEESIARDKEKNARMKRDELTREKLEEIRIPPFSQLDRSVVLQLPVVIREELAKVYEGKDQQGERKKETKNNQRRERQLTLLCYKRENGTTTRTNVTDPGRNHRERNSSDASLDVSKSAFTTCEDGDESSETEVDDDEHLVSAKKG